MHPRPRCAPSGRASHEGRDRGFTHARGDAPSVDGKRAQQGPHRRQLFLILHRHGRLADRSCARWTDGGERGVVRFVNLGGNGPVRATAIGRSGLAAGASRVLRGPVLGKQRGLSESCTPCGLELSRSRWLSRRSRSFSRRTASRSLSARSARSRSASLRSGGSVAFVGRRSGTSTLCQIPDKSTSTICWIGRAVRWMEWSEPANQRRRFLKRPICVPVRRSSSTLISSSRP